MSDTVYSEADVIRHALATGGFRRPSANGRPVLDDFCDIVNCVMWLQILAVPRIFCCMTRMPPREHLVRLIDIFLAYVSHDGRYATPDFEPVPYETREPLALKLRELLEAWTPPELPAEITEAARALLYAEGMSPPPGGWDSAPDPDRRPEEYLLWPEGVPALMARERGEPSDEGDAR
ncbi:MAG TPA: hypothetical protein VE093_26065 [Polyangiaceae bacterium]|nr:hypothetical protein [Polyangiaceae bacterium]